MLSVAATVTTPTLDKLIAELPTRLQAACTTTAHTIQAAYEAEAPRDTGSLALSVTVSTPDGQTDFGQRTALADAVNPRVRIMDLLPPPPAPGAIVQVPVQHGVFVEYGTTRMPARPVFTRVTEAARAPFAAAVAQALEP